jgi:parvulin-like peptidyl-prolyl isomerase
MKFFFIAVFILSAFIASASTTSYDKIHIIVNDHIITQNEIKIRLSEYIRQSARGQTLPEKKVEELRSQMINLLIEEALLDIRADELKIVLSDAQLDGEVDNYRKQNKLSQIEFEELLERQQLTPTDFRNRYLKRTRRSQVINREIRSQISIADETLRALYDKGEGKTIRVHARHILLVLKKDASPETVQKVKQKLSGIKKQIESGKSFSEMADLHSQDPSVKRNHGDLGYFGKTDMVREFAEVSFSLDPGTLSEPVRSPFGFHLIEVLDKKEDPQESFDKVKQKLSQQVFKEAYENKYEAYMKELKLKASIKKR